MARNSVLNLTVHGIGAPPRTLDPGEDEVWVTVDRFERVLDVVVGRSDVRITFDDGNTSDLELGLPRLLERGLTARFFVLAGLLGEPGRLDEDGVRELLGAGMSIGSHGWAHRDWRAISPAEVRDEMIEAPRRLSGLTGGPVADVAIPFGSYDRRVLSRLRHAGARRVYTSDGGRADPDRWLQSRTSLRHDTAPADVRRELDGHPAMWQRARRSAVTCIKRHRP